MNAQVIGLLARHFLSLVGGYMAAAGVSGEEWEQIAGGLAALAAVLWSMVEKRRRAG